MGARVQEEKETGTHLSSHIDELWQPQVLAHLSLQEVQEAPCEEDNGHQQAEPFLWSPSSPPVLTLAHVLSDDVDGLL